MNKPTVLCLFGGKSSEYEVSLKSAYSILTNIDRQKYDVLTLGITKTGDWLLYTGDIEKIPGGSWCEDSADTKKAFLSASPNDKAIYVLKDNGSAVEKVHIDVIFPVMHGSNAEDGTLQGLLELSGIAYVGCGCAASAIGMDKAYTKLILNNYGIPQAKCEIINEFRFLKDKDGVITACEEIGPYPLFVKPANAGSSVGASKASSREELIVAIGSALLHDTKVIVEEYISGKEIEVAVMGNGNNKGAYKISACGQINPGAEFYDYDAKYSESSTSSTKIPADIKKETADKVRQYAGQICAALGVCGLSRVDFFVTADEKIIFNEINTLPGFTTISMYPKLMMDTGMTYTEIIDSLIYLALKKGASK